jgi:polyketide synthase-associated protein
MALAKKEAYDVVAAAEAKVEDLAYDAITFLSMKGFCRVDAGFPEDVTKEAHVEARAIERFAPPEPMVVEALLGPEASLQIADLEGPNVDPEDRTDGDNLRKLDQFMTEFADELDVYMPDSMGFSCGFRTIGMLHMAVASDSDPEEFTEKKAAKWLHIFRRHRFMCCYFLAPKGGQLTLKPFDEESDETVLNVKFGEMVILRADALTHSYTPGSEKDIVLSCFLLGPDRHGYRGAFSDGRDEAIPMIPVVRDIYDWAGGRLLAIKENLATEGGSLKDQEIPRSWKLAASHYIYKGVQVAVRGVAVNMPTKMEKMDSLHGPMIQGCDFAVEIPFTRWNHFEGNPWLGMYDPDPKCYMTNRVKTSIKHATFIEGQDLFDNKFFNMSILESKVTDPCQRLALEGAYEALHMCGWNRKGLMQAFIGVYQGHTASDWDKIEHDQAGGCAGSYSPTIASNRVSFALGIMGPSFTIDVEGASSLAAIYQGAHDVMPSLDFKKPLVAGAMCGGVTLNLSSYWWPVHNQFMNPAGRSFSFDHLANGYVKGEGACSVGLKRHAELVEGEVIVDESKQNIAIISGWSMINNGVGASLTAPNGPALQRMISDTCRIAAISPLDVDSCEVDGRGDLMQDAVEVSSSTRVLRNLPGGEMEVVGITATKSKQQFAQETSGIASFLATMVAQRHGVMSPNIGLKAVNPYINFPEDIPVDIITEATSYRCRSSYNTCLASGFGGTNAGTTVYCDLNEEKFGKVTRPALDRQVFAFWPGGGGQLEDEAVPEKGYMIVGSWGSWNKPEKMKPEGDKNFGFTVTMGENRCEQFQILIDGNFSKAMHPGLPSGGSGGLVYGPVDREECGGLNWVIDGRPQQMVKPAPSDSGAEALMDYYSVKGKDFGMPGDMYHITLQVSGKWRTVTWEKVDSKEPVPDKVYPLTGTYFVTGSFNNWEFAEMTSTGDNTCSVDVKVTGAAWDTRTQKYSFQIVRNQDWGQVLYPSSANAVTGSDSASVGGPDADSGGLCWMITAKVGDVFTISLQRQVTAESDTKSVTWTQK